jgi:hypothetical protein
MSLNLAAAPDAEMELRWRAWQIRGLEGDRRRASLMNGVISVIAIALAIGLFALVV